MLRNIILLALSSMGFTGTFTFRWGAGIALIAIATLPALVITELPNIIEIAKLGEPNGAAAEGDAL